MSLPLPNLDDRSYTDLLAELRSRIPSLCPQWTDHNPADPGITLLELFTWLTEMLLYRVNRVPDKTVRTFLQLLNGREPGPDLDKEISDLVQDLRRPFRAVTAADYEALALEVEGVARARCVPRRNPDSSAPAPGWVSVIVVPRPAEEFLDRPSPYAPPLPSQQLLTRVVTDLEPRRLLTVRQAVIPPRYVPIVIEAGFVRRPDAGPLLKADAETAIRHFLDPYTGGPEGEGWPFGRDVYLSEIYQVLEAVPGLDFVSDVKLSSDAGRTETWFEPAAEILHPSGDPVGLRLASHLLPWITRVTVKEA